MVVIRCLWCALLGEGEVKGGVVYEIRRYSLRVSVRFP